MIVQSSTPGKSEVCVAGVDLVLNLTGVCVSGSGRVRTHIIDGSALRGRKRLAFIRDDLVRLVMAHAPVLVALEGYSFMSENRPFDMGEVGSILKILTYDAGIPLLIVAPKQLKKFVTGHGSASKAQMIKAVAKYYGILTDDDNIADAVGLMRVCHVYLTGQSTRRCELELVKKLKHPMVKKKVRFKKERGAM
jgi:Holliday junction resolvasome RuvABC endonuclease subunit